MGSSEQRKDLDQCPGGLDLTNGETDDTIREQFYSQAQWGAREVKEHVPLSHRWKDNRRKRSRQAARSQNEAKRSKGFMDNYRLTTNPAQNLIKFDLWRRSGRPARTSDSKW